MVVVMRLRGLGLSVTCGRYGLGALLPAAISSGSHQGFVVLDLGVWHPTGVDRHTLPDLELLSS
jgi:hypothetical protein